MKPHHLYGACPADKKPARVNEKGYAYPLEVSPVTYRYFRWRYPDLWVVATDKVTWAFDVLYELESAIGLAGIILIPVAALVGFGYFLGRVL
jgi:hypothetical protein